MQSIVSLQAKEQYFTLRQEFLTYKQNLDMSNMELTRSKYLKWKESFCRDSSNEMLLGFIKNIKEESKNYTKEEILRITNDAIIPVKEELYKRVASQVEKTSNTKIDLMITKFIDITKYYDQLACSDNLQDKSELVKDYINEVLKNYTVEENIILVSLLEEEIQKYVVSTFKNKYAYTKGYKLYDSLKEQIIDKVIEENYYS